MKSQFSLFILTLMISAVFFSCSEEELTTDALSKNQLNAEQRSSSAPLLSIE